MYFGISELGHWVNNKVAASKALSMLTPKFLSSWDLKVPCASNISCLLMISPYNQEKRLWVLIKWSPNRKMLLLCLLSCVLYLPSGFLCLLSFMLSSALYAVWYFLPSALLSAVWFLFFFSVFHVLSSTLVSSVFCLSFSVFCSTVCCLVISVFHVLSSALRFGVQCLVSSVYHALSFDLASSVWCLVFLIFHLLSLVRCHECLSSISCL